MRKGHLQVESFLFECTGVNIEVFVELNRLGYRLYRLNVHIGAKIFAPSGVDMNKARFPNHSYALPPYFKEKFFVRQMRSVWEVDSAFLASGRPSTSQLAWPFHQMHGMVQYVAVLGDWSESVLYLPRHNGGPLEAPGVWTRLKMKGGKLEKLGQELADRGWY